METSQELCLLFCHATAFQNEPSRDATATVASLAVSLVCYLRYHILVLPIPSPTVTPTNFTLFSLLFSCPCFFHILTTEFPSVHLDLLFLPSSSQLGAVDS